MRLADNDVYLSIDGVVLTARFISVKPSLSTEENDSTAGGGVDWDEVAPGLHSLTLAINIEYDTTEFDNYIQHIATGQIVSIEWGPQGAVSGKPRHVQDFHISKNDYEIEVKKKPAAFDITAKSSGAPSVNLYAGGKYS